MPVDSNLKRELVQRLVLAELLARRGEGPLARRVFSTTPRLALAMNPDAPVAREQEP